MGLDSTDAEMTNQFQLDLCVGNKVEELVVEMIKRKYPTALRVFGIKEYDILIPEINKRVEVKSDQKSRITGNYLIEIEMFDKPSALFATTADYWCIFNGDDFLWIKPMKIVECIIFNELRWREVVGRGDTAPKKAYLIKDWMLRKYGKPCISREIKTGKVYAL